MIGPIGRKIVFGLVRSRSTVLRVERFIERLEQIIGVGAGYSAANSGERVLSSVVRSICAGNPTIIDGGANRGQFLSVIGRDLCDMHPQIHCFEPTEVAFSVLKTATIPEGITVFFRQCGLSNESRKATLYSEAPGSKMSSLYEREFNDLLFDHYEDVSLTTIDQYSNENSIKEIDLLKMDIEGHELSALMGAKNMLNSSSIKSIMFEFGSPNIDSRVYFRDLYNFVINHGLEVYRILPSSRLLRISEYSYNLERYRTSNYLAIHKGVLKKIPDKIKID